MIIDNGEAAIYYELFEPISVRLTIHPPPAV